MNSYDPYGIKKRGGQLITENYKFYYEENIPVLFFSSNISAFERGYHQGLLFYNQTKWLVFRMKFIYFFLKHFQKYLKYFRIMKNTFFDLDEIILTCHIPLEDLNEIQGFVEGFNTKTNCLNELTLELAIFYHIIPDIFCYGFGCSTIVDQKGRFIIRNLDFCPFGSGGRDSVLIKAQELSYLTIPGMIGVCHGWTTTAIKSRFVFVNVSHNDTYFNSHGIPMVFYSKEILRRINWNIENIKRYHSHPEFDQVLPKKQPMASFHLTIVDNKKAICISFAQTLGDDNIIHDNNQGPLKIFNFTHTIHDEDKGTAWSMTRNQTTDQFLSLQQYNVSELMDFIRDKNINVFDTIHSLIILPSFNHIFISCNDSFAASGKFSIIPK